MNSEILDIDAWRQVLIEWVSAIGSTVAEFLPKLLATSLILLIGWMVSKAIEIVARGALARMGLDRASDRLRLSGNLGRAGVRGPLSRIVSRALFWVVMLTFVLSAVETLGLVAVTHTIDRFLAFLPSVIAGGLILVFGLLLSRFVRDVVSSGAAAANFSDVRRIGAVASAATTIIVVVLAMEQVGIDTAILVTAATVLLSALSVTVGVTFALGARPILTHILAGHYLRQSLPVAGSVEVGGRRGEVERVGPVDTVFRSADERWSMPNARLLEEIIQR